MKDPTPIQHAKSWVTSSDPGNPLSPQVQVITVGLGVTHKITGRKLVGGPVTELRATPVGKSCNIRIVLDGVEYAGSFSKADVVELLGWVSR
jgi:hypothetical protein